MAVRFGTDGIRGVANADLTPELIVALGRATARVLIDESLGADRPFVIGRDTRRSGPLLEAALVAGLTAEGVAVERLGVLPTPGVAFACAAHDVAGAVISASHNPFPDNGVKLFARGGRKLNDALQAAVEAALDEELSRPNGSDRAPLTGAQVGTVIDPAGVADAYVAHLVGALAGRTLAGVKVVVDCGHGAASVVGPAALRAAGAEVVVLNDQPNGININDGCGATAPAAMREAVVEHGAHAGLAFDGDADRVMAADELGGLVDGDHLLAVVARDLDQRGLLPGHSVVGTVMANLGLRNALAEASITFIETPVGDRAVLEAMERDDIALGAEQSGHVIFAEHATTGDGVLTGLLLLDAMARAAVPLSELASVVVKWPQVLRNVRVERGELDRATAFWNDVVAVETELGDKGRVLVRPSGTEPVVRVMIEAATAEQANGLADRLVDALTRAIGERPAG
jgi:phosphoglucosamine mutase